jgi:hypothetical protein
MTVARPGGARPLVVRVGRRRRACSLPRRGPATGDSIHDPHASAPLSPRQWEPSPVRLARPFAAEARKRSPDCREAMSIDAVSSRWPILLLVFVAACASTRVVGGGTETGTELAGTPSASGCDAWFEVSGTFARQHDIRYTLRNRSTNPACSATGATVLFSGQLSRATVRVSAPPGWTTRDVPCQTGGGVCGIEWRTRDGVLAGHELPGFGLTYPATKSPRQKVWIVDVGGRRVEMPIGTVGG